MRCEACISATKCEMAPKSTTVTVERTSLEVIPELDCNQNEVVERVWHPAGPKRPSNGGDVNERSRKLIKSCFSHLKSNLNVLVIGTRGSGKSSFINSMNMALTQEWKDRARYCPGRKHIIDQCVMFHNHSRKSHHHSHKSSDGKVVFWDTRGFEDIHCEEHAVLILRYVLEGRIPPKCIPCVLLMSREIIKKRYHKITSTDRRIDLVLNVAALDQEPQTRLMKLIQQAITTSKHASVNKIPILSVATKSDNLSESEVRAKMERLHEYSLEKLVDEQRQSSRPYRRRRHLTAPDVSSSTKLVVNYCCELEPWSDESLNPSSVQPSPELDSPLLAVWREIVSRTAACGGSDARKRAYSASTGGRPMCRCLPFRIGYDRLRSASF